MDYRQKIDQLIDWFGQWLEKSQEARRWERERRQRQQWFKEKLGPKAIDNFNIKDFAKLIKDLWASSVWQNKDYKVQYLIENNGFPKIKKELKVLLYGKSQIEKRWDVFREAIKGLGPSSISEILAFFDPRKYAIINLKIYKVLPRLGIPIKIVRKGKDYQKAIDSLEKIKQRLVKNGIKNVDFITTDFFIAYLFYEVFDLAYKRHDQLIDSGLRMEKPEETQQKLKQKRIKIDSHEAAEAILLRLGNLLGYDTYTPDKGRTVNGQKLGEIATLEELPYFAPQKVMDSAENVDVIWLQDEWPEYFFEVEHTTGVTSGLLRIYQAAEKLNSKFFIIGPQRVLKKFEKEIEKSPFNKIKNKYKFRSYKQLEEMFLIAKRFKEISDKFL